MPNFHDTEIIGQLDVFGNIICDEITPKKINYVNNGFTVKTNDYGNGSVRMMTLEDLNDNDIIGIESNLITGADTNLYHLLQFKSYDSNDINVDFEGITSFGQFTKDNYMLFGNLNLVGYDHSILVPSEDGTCCIGMSDKKYMWGYYYTLYAEDINLGNNNIIRDIDGVLYQRKDGVNYKIFSEVQPPSGSSNLSEDVTLNGVSVGNFDDGDTIAQGTSFTDFVKALVTKAIPPTYTKPTLKVGIGGNVNTTTIMYEVGYSFGMTFPYRITNNDGDAHQLVHTIDGASDTVVPLVVGSTTTLNLADRTVDDGSLQIKFVMNYYGASVKNNNLGQPDSTGIFGNGSVTKYVYLTGIRKAFYTADANTVVPTTSALVRGLGSSTSNSKNGNAFNISIQSGDRRVVFAYPKREGTVLKVEYVELGNADVTDTFTRTEVTVEGLNGHSPIDYYVYSYKPQVAFGSSATYKVTI